MEALPVVAAFSLTFLPSRAQAPSSHICLVGYKNEPYTVSEIKSREEARATSKKGRNWAGLAASEKGRSEGERGRERVKARQG